MGADLTGADLTSTLLSGVDLRHADLSGANLTSAVLTGVRVFGLHGRVAEASGAECEWVDTSEAGDGSERQSGEALWRFIERP